MEKIFSKRKIIVLSIAILVAIFSLSIAIFGIFELNKNKKQSEGATAKTFKLGSKSYTIYQGETGARFKFYDEEACQNLALSYERNSVVYHIYSLKGFFYFANGTQTSRLYSITLHTNIVIPANSGFTGIGSNSSPYMKEINYNGYIITNNTSYPLINTVKLELSSVADLKEFASKVNSGTTYQGLTVKLINNISFSSSDSFTPIGNSSYSFKGTFDGQCYTISKLPKCYFKYQSVQHYGMFYKLNGIVQNLRIDDTNWTIDSTWDAEGCNAGVLVSKISSEATINDCVFTDSSIKFTTDEFAPRCGALVGYIESGTLNINNVGVNVNIDAAMEWTSRNTLGMAIGGMLGDNDGTVNVNNSYYNGSIKIDSYDECYFGGIHGSFGLSFNDNKGVVNVINTYINFTSINVEINSSNFSSFTYVQVQVLGKDIKTNSNNKYYVGTYSIKFPEDWTDEGYNYVLTQSCTKIKLI